MSGWAKFHQAETSNKVVVIWTPMWKKNTLHTAYMKHHETIKNLIMKNGWITGSLMHKKSFCISLYNFAFRLQKQFAERTVAPWAKTWFIGPLATMATRWIFRKLVISKVPNRLHAAVAISSWLAQPSTNAPWTVPFLLGTLGRQKPSTTHQKVFNHLGPWFSLLCFDSLVPIIVN